MSPRRLKAELTDAKQSIISFGMYVADLEKALKKRGYIADRIQAMRRKHNLDGTMEMSNGDVVTFDIIMNAVCLHYKQDPTDVRGTRKPTSLVNPRHMFCYLAKKNMPQVSLKEIGEYLGGKDHSSIIHAQQKIIGFLSFDKAIQRDYNQIIELIK